MRLFNAVIMPTMLYGIHSWAMTTERRQRVRATQRRMMRTILGRHWKPGEDYVDWTKAATEEAEQTMRKHNVPDWVTVSKGECGNGPEKLLGQATEDGVTKSCSGAPVAKGFKVGHSLVGRTTSWRSCGKRLDRKLVNLIGYPWLQTRNYGPTWKINSAVSWPNPTEGAWPRA